jgi:DNA mismatch endonuclease (patch repair protein)
MQANRRRDTAPEMAIRRLVHASGLRYRVDARPLANVRHTADIVFTRAKVAVFIDGCWWHGCAEHYRPPASNIAYWADKVGRNRARDRQIDQVLISADWTVIRIWEHESPEPAARRIEAVVRSVNASPQCDQSPAAEPVEGQTVQGNRSRSNIANSGRQPL